MRLNEIDARYPVILCDIWGCIHDGVELYPGAAARLRRWRDNGQTTILITNAPRTAEAVAAQLRGLGLDLALWRGIATSGDAGISRLKMAQRPVGFIGTRSDRAILEDRGVRIGIRMTLPSWPAQGSTKCAGRCPNTKSSFGP